MQHSVRNHSADALKTLCAFTVVAIHTPLFCKQDIRMVYAFAVPCFFMLSGFFLFSADKGQLNARLVKTIKTVARLTLWSTAFYLIGHVVQHGHCHISATDWRNWIVFTWPPFPGMGHLWYLYAYLYALIALRLINGRHWLAICKAITPLILLFPFCIEYGEQWFGLPYIPMFMGRNWLFEAIPFIVIGMWVKQRIESLRALPHARPLAIATTAVLAALTLAEYHLLSPEWHIMGFTSIPYSVVMFLCFVLPRQSADNWIARIGREDSLYIYIFHIFAIQMTHLAIAHLGNDTVANTFEAIGPFFIFPLTLIAVRLVRVVLSLLRRPKPC